MEKRLVAFSRFLSIIFNPFYLPLVGMILLFWCTYLNLLPWEYKLTVVLLVYVFTILLPTLFIRLYSRYQGWRRVELGQKEHRIVPYIISLVCYFACYYIMDYFHIPHFINLLLVIALAVQVVCAIINVWWKVSTHSAAIGAVTGTIVIFSLYFGFYLTWWLCLALVVSGLVGSSRLILRLHTLPQVVVGYCVGIVLAITIVLFV